MRSHKKIFQENINSTSIIIPIYNEEHAIIKNSEKILKSFKNIKVDYEVIFVESGSNDNSLAELKALEKKFKILIFQETQRNGYGSAIKLGFRNSKFKRICFFPIDDQYDAEELVKILNNSNCSNIITFRKSTFTGYFRKIQSYLFKSITKTLLNLKFIDINSLKILNRKDFPYFNRFSDNWNIDLEILIYIQKLNIMYEEKAISLKKRNIGDSKVSLFDTINIIFNLISLKLRG